METSSKSLRNTYNWAQSRITELCSRGDFEEVVNGDSIRQEFGEWLGAKSRKEMNEIHVIFLEYIGKGSEYD